MRFSGGGVWQLGHLSSPYIYDSYLQGEDYDRCLENIIGTVRLLYTLGFVIHPKKSVLIPTQRLTFLGFILDSILMRIYMTPEKVNKVIGMCSKLLKRHITNNPRGLPSSRLYYFRFPRGDVGPPLFLTLGRS